MSVIGLHLFLLFTAFSVFIFLGFTTIMPTPETLNHWDSGWYHSIVTTGYQFKAGAQSNVAFFPFFPYLWKFLNLGVRGISLVNFTMFLTAFYFLSREFKIQSREALFFLSLPSILFMYVPYTEASFFVFAAVLLIGLHRRSQLLIIAGLFFCCVTRSATLLFFPAIIFMECMDAETGKTALQKVKNILLYLAVAVLALLAVAYIQWYQTGQWFPFFGVHKYWNHELRLPEFPLTTWGGFRLLWLDGVALWVGAAAGAFCSFLLYRYLAGRPLQLPYHRAVVFSAGYMVGASVFVMLYQGGSIILHRYIFATPFFFVFFSGLLRNAPGLKAVAIIGGLTLLSWLMLGAHTRLDGMTHLKTIWYFLLMTLYIMACLLLNHRRWGHYIAPAVYGLGIILQLYLFNQFLKGEWAG